MRKIILYCVLAVFCLSTGSVLMALSKDVKEFPACKHCGMSRETFAHSRILIEYEDDSTVGTCSLRCASVDFALNLDKAPKTISVGDYNTKELINAETAAWVIGGKSPGL